MESTKNRNHGGIKRKMTNKKSKKSTIKIFDNESKQEVTDHISIAIYPDKKNNNEEIKNEIYIKLWSFLSFQLIISASSWFLPLFMPSDDILSFIGIFASLTGLYSIIFYLVKRYIITKDNIEVMAD